MDNISKPNPSEKTSFTPNNGWHVVEMTITRSVKSYHRLNNKNKWCQKRTKTIQKK